MADRRNDSICVKIVRAIANYDDVPVSELDFFLHDHIDTEALERLDRQDNTQWTVHFEVDDHDVAVRDDRTIWIDGYEFEKMGD